MATGSFPGAPRALALVPCRTALPAPCCVSLSLPCRRGSGTYAGPAGAAAPGHFFGGVWYIRALALKVVALHLINSHVVPVTLPRSCTGCCPTRSCGAAFFTDSPGLRCMPRARVRPVLLVSHPHSEAVRSSAPRFMVRYDPVPLHGGGGGGSAAQQQEQQLRRQTSHRNVLEASPQRSPSPARAARRTLRAGRPTQCGRRRGGGAARGRHLPPPSPPRPRARPRSAASLSAASLLLYLLVCLG